LKECLASIRNQTYGNVEIILVNNGSHAFRAEEFGDFRIDKLICNEKNLGFARANNQGILASEGEFVLLLNADAKIPPNFLEIAMARFREREDAFALVPQIRIWGSENRVETTGHILRRDFTCAHRDHNRAVPEATITGGEVFGGSAACIIYRRRGLDLVSLGDEFFDESFFSYFEDVDLDIRANLCGLKYYYEPALIAYHIGAGSGARTSKKILLLAEKNRYLSLAKNLTIADALPNLPDIFVYEGYHFLKTLLSPYLFLSFFLFLWHLPKALIWRREILKRRVVSPREFSRWLVSRFSGSQAHSTARVNFPEGTAQDTELSEKIERPLSEKLSVILVSYGRYELTRSCLLSLRNQTFKDFSIILVDNTKAGDDGKRLAEEFKEIIVIFPGKNLGFAQGVNLAYSKTHSEYIVLLNNDAEAEPEFLENLVEAMEREKADAGCGVLVEADCPPTNDALNFLLYTIKGAYGAKSATFYPSGGATILRRSSIEKLNAEIFDPDYFLYYEDVALGWKIRIAGGNVIKVPQAKAHHKAQGTVSLLPSSIVRYFQLRNRLLTIFTYMEGVSLAKLMPFLILDFVYWHLKALTSLSVLRAVLRTDLSIVFSVLKLLRKRAGVCDLRRRSPLRTSENAQVNDREIFKWFSGRIFPNESLINRLALSYLNLVHLPYCEKELADI